MASYGWTLDQALDLTYPQIKALYRSLIKWPTVNMFAAGFAHMNAGNDAIDKLGNMRVGSVTTVEGEKEFLERLGIKPEAEG